MKFKSFLILAFSAFLFFSCGSKRKTVSNSDKRNVNVPAKRTTDSRQDIPAKRYADVVDEYIDLFAETAKEEMRLYRIPASITLAQGILESGAGRGDLTRRANNHFGIKCHDWTGDRAFHDDDRRGECFRKYNDPRNSYRDHSLFLAERRRYAALFDLAPDDYEGWANGLKAAGYATDRLYPRKLIDIIERYSLYNYDAEVLGYRAAPAKVVQKQGVRHVVQKGDTLYSIARHYNVTVEMLQQFNNLNSTNIAIGQELYVQQ